jgi:hypothetical protein
MSAAVANPPNVRLVEYVCPVCKPLCRRVLVKAAPGSIVEAYCRHCRYRKIVRIV